VEVFRTARRATKFVGIAIIGIAMNCSMERHDILHEVDNWHAHEIGFAFTAADTTALECAVSALPVQLRP
jgi:predicted Na+-dependent transporter